MEKLDFPIWSIWTSILVSWICARMDTKMLWDILCWIRTRSNYFCENKLENIFIEPNTFKKSETDMFNFHKLLTLIKYLL